MAYLVHTHICSSPLLISNSDLNLEGFKKSLKSHIEDADRESKVYGNPRHWEKGAVHFYSKGDEPVVPILREFGFEELVCGPITLFTHALPDIYDKLEIKRI